MKLSLPVAEKYLAALLRVGDTTKALSMVSRGDKWRWACRTNIEGFAAEEDALLGRARAGMPAVPGFGAFRAKYFAERGITHPHMQPWIDLAEDDSVRRSIIIGPPEHGRSTVMTVQRLAWRACREAFEVAQLGREPDWPLRAAIISNSDMLAERFGWQLSRYLTDPAFSGDMIADYGPFRLSGRQARWSASEMYFAWRSASEKDPSVQLLGWNKGLQSARLTDAVLDDVDSPMAGKAERGRMLRFIDQILIPRLGKHGRLTYLCNRVDEMDVAREILERAEDGTWTAVVQAALSPEGVPLWLERYDPEHFDDVRRQLRNDRLFSLVYQSKPLSGDSVDFPLSLVEQARDPERALGSVPQGATVICALDPATRGGAGVIAYAIDPRTQRRYVVDADWGTERRAMGLRKWIEEYTMRYRPRVFAIETQGGYDIMEDDQIVSFLRDYECTMVPLKTGQLKNSADYGVSSLRRLFDADPTLRQVSIPWGDDMARRKMGRLIEQFASYHPESNQPYDLVMCVWFAERVIADHHIVRSARRERIADPLAQRWRGTHQSRSDRMNRWRNVG